MFINVHKTEMGCQWSATKTKKSIFYRKKQTKNKQNQDKNTTAANKQFKYI